MIGIVDYGAGNIRSVQNAFDKIDAKTKLINNPDELIKCDKIVLPGVGAFKDAMDMLIKINLDEAIKEFIKKEKPFLGICLGLQLLFEKSEEFENTKGLGILEGEVVKFDKDKFNHSFKVPHMGWNLLSFQKNSVILKNIEDSFYMYFVHSYHVVCSEDIVLAKTNYGYPFISMVQKNNIFGIQPHPEKSGEIGIKILRNFKEI